MADEIGVGLVGFGLAGKVFHAPLISSVPGLRLQAIVARSNAAEAKAAYPEARVAAELDDLLNEANVQVVVIASPNALHAEQATRALAAGRDVVVDKPLAVNGRQARDLMEFAAARKRLLTVFQNRRWDGDYLTLRELIAGNAVGRVVSFESHFDRFSPQGNKAKPWKEAADGSGGLLLDLGSHLVDQAIQLFGEPQDLFADVRTERVGSVAEDAFDVMLRCGGVRVLLRASMLACDPGPRFVLRGDAGTYTKWGLDVQEKQLRLGERPRRLDDDEQWGREPAEAWGTLVTPGPVGTNTTQIETIRGRYPAFYVDLRDALLGKHPPAVTAAEAVRVMELLDAARQSSRNGRMISFP